MYKIIYNANPSKPQHLNHEGSMAECTVQDERSFETLDEMVDFYYKCHWPITQLTDYIEDFKKQYRDYSEEELSLILSIAETREEDIPTEVILENQRSLYNLT